MPVAISTSSPSDRSVRESKTISIEYAVMEKTDRAEVVPVACGCSPMSDLGADGSCRARDEQQRAHGRRVSRIRETAMFRTTGVVALEGVDDLVGGGDARMRAGVAPEDANGMKRLVRK